MQRTNAARRAATFCRAASGHIDREKSNKLQATSNKLQAGGWVPRLQAATFRALNQELAVVIWSRAARELVSTIQYKPCEACLWGEAGGSSQQQKGKYDKNRQTKRHRCVLQRSRQDGHHQTPSGGEDLVPAHGHSGCSARCSSRGRTRRENQTRRVRTVEAFQKRRLTHPRINSIMAPVQLGPSCIPSRSHKLQASSAKLLKVQAASFKRRAASLKLQAASGKLKDLVSFIKFHAARGEGLY